MKLMKPILFVTATAKEMKAALGGVCKLPRLEQGKPVEFMFGDRPGLLLVTGIGVINTSFALGGALAGNDVGVVVLAGIAGTFNADRFPLCSACVVRKEIWPEYGLKKDDQVDPKGWDSALRRLTVIRSGTKWNYVPEKVFLNQDLTDLKNCPKLCL